jgi:photosystem II stability/assembly factor-like uncharacterized protein
MPNVNNMPVSDLCFLDSLNGFAITGDQTPNDTNYILKTTNSGDNWIIIYRAYRNHLRINFLNLNTGFVCGGFNTSSGELIKTTNSGNNWFPLNTPGSIWYDDMSVLNDSTIWLVQRSSLDGGVFFTSNGGANWQNQFSGGNQNPNKIYMYNARIGFMSNSSALPNIYKTTNGGVNWILNLPGENFTDMYFVDSLTGWKCMPGFIAGDSCVKKTTNGGNSWLKQRLPTGGIINISQIVKFSFLNRDTIYGVGGQVNYGGFRYRGIIYRTVNGGSNWLFQVPDTSFGIAGFGSIQFINKNIGWAYFNTTGIHTTNGGDTTFLVGLQQISTEVPTNFILFQNYPNPFNPVTNIKYSVMPNTKGKIRNVKLIVYDITGKEVITLVNQDQEAGTYQVDFTGYSYSSGIYFYKITIENGKEVFTETKKMLLVK